MLRFFLFRRRRKRVPSEDDKSRHVKVDQLVSDSFASLQRPNPDTGIRWLQLRRAVEGREAIHLQPRRIPRLAYALVALAAAAFSVYLFNTAHEPAREQYTTEPGQQLRVALHDQSEIFLNASTHLEVERIEKGKPRRVVLAGEALFRVYANGRPFTVETAYGTIEVVGTEFNVRARDRKMEVALLKGTVKVRSQDSTLVLAPRQMAVCFAGTVPERVGIIPADEYPGWMIGKLFLHQTSFEEACKELELRFAISITTEDQRVRAAVISGVVDARTPHTALRTLCALVRKNYRYDGTVYYIY